MSTPERSEQINELAAALAKAQSKLKNPTKDGKGNYGKYVTLAAAIEAAAETVAENGLSITQWIGEDDRGNILTTYLLHSSGQYISNTMRLHVTKPDSQALGSSVSYARRYSYMAVLGLAADADDSEAAVQNNQQQGNQQQNKASQNKASQNKPAQNKPAQNKRSQGNRQQAAPSKTAEPIVNISNMVARLKKEAPHKADELKAYWPKVAKGYKAEAVPQAAGKALETKINELIAEGKRADEPVVDPETGEVLNPKKDSPVAQARQTLENTKGPDTPEGWETN